MKRRTHNNLHTGMKTSPWIILGSTVILLIVVIVLAVQNTNREKQYMSKILREKGKALIRAVEAGARTGMMGMMWGGSQIQQLLEETARLPDVLYLAVVDPDGLTVAHSDPSKVDTPFRPNHKVVHLGPDLEENWALVPYGKNQRAFEVHRRFEPTKLWPREGFGRMRGRMHMHSEMPDSTKDWYRRLDEEQFLIIVGLDIAPFQKAINEDIRTTVLLSVVLLLAGFGGFLSLFWMNTYRSAKRTLQDTSAFADEVVTHLPVGLIATDRNDRITFFNPMAATITAISSDSAMGCTLGDVLPAQLCGLKDGLDNGDTITDKELECIFSNGRSVPLSASTTSIVNEEKEFIGRILILRDLTEVRRLQEEVRRQEKLAALGGLAAGVAHEIRNPLSSIKGLATFFATQFEDGSESKQAAGVMVREVDRLNRAITELLDFARPTDLRCKPTDLAPLLSRSIQLIQKETASLSIQIDAHIADNLCQVMIDADRIAQCLLNIYLNAMQAMTEGGTLTIRCEPEGEKYARIKVSDTGPGITSDHLNRIFDPYFTTKNKGTGLGLALVHKIMEAHQAQLKVESPPGKGATFTLRFACHRCHTGKRNP